MFRSLSPTKLMNKLSSVSKSVVANAKNNMSKFGVFAKDKSYIMSLLTKIDESMCTGKRVKNKKSMLPLIKYVNFQKVYKFTKKKLNPGGYAVQYDKYMRASQRFAASLESMEKIISAQKGFGCVVTNDQVRHFQEIIKNAEDVESIISQFTGVANKYMALKYLPKMAKLISPSNLKKLFGINTVEEFKDIMESYNEIDWNSPISKECAAVLEKLAKQSGGRDFIRRRILNPKLESINYMISGAILLPTECVKYLNKMDNVDEYLEILDYVESAEILDTNGKLKTVYKESLKEIVSRKVIPNLQSLTVSGYGFTKGLLQHDDLVLKIIPRLSKKYLAEKYSEFYGLALDYYYEGVTCDGSKTGTMKLREKFERGLGKRLNKSKYECIIKVDIQHFQTAFTFSSTF